LQHILATVLKQLPLGGEDMMHFRKLIVLATTLLALASCGALNKPIAGKAQQPAPNAEGVASQPSTPVQMVPEFEDIPVPVELDRNDELSSVYEAPGVIVGVVVYEGYNKGGSIAKFFRNEMPKQEWQFLNAFSEGKRYTIAFLKSNRSCMITIHEGSLSTKVTIKVGPTSSGG